MHENAQPVAMPAGRAGRSGEAVAVAAVVVAVGAGAGTDGAGVVALPARSQGFGGAAGIFAEAVRRRHVLPNSMFSNG